MNYQEARSLSDGSGWHMTIKNDDRIWTHVCCCTRVLATAADVAATGWLYHRSLKVGDLIAGPPHEPHPTREAAEDCYHAWRLAEIESSLEFADELFSDWQGCRALVAESRLEVIECPTPEYHVTHRYCPSCPWREGDDRRCDAPTKGGGRYQDDHRPENVALCPDHRTLGCVLEQVGRSTKSIYS